MKPTHVANGLNANSAVWPICTRQHIRLVLKNMLAFPVGQCVLSFRPVAISGVFLQVITQS